MSCTAAFNQKAFRGRNDDGNETTATWKAAQNANWGNVLDTNLRVRLEVQETAGCAYNNFNTIQLQYNKNAAGWNNVTGSSSVVKSVASPNLADGADTTDQLTVGTGTFVGGGGFDEVNGVAGNTSMDIAASGHFEVEYCIQIVSADTASNDSIQLRATDGGTAFGAYDVTPSILLPLRINVASSTITVSESPTLLFNYAVNVSDIVTITEGAHPAPRLVPMMYVAETITLTEDRTISLVTPASSISINVSDAIAIAEDTPLNIIVMPTVFDAITIIESAMPHPVLQPNLFDAVTLTEDAPVMVAIMPILFDTITVTENAPVSVTGLILNVSDSTSLTESGVVMIAVMPTVFDTSTLTEVSVSMLAIMPTVFDTAALTETAVTMIALMPILFENVTLTEDRTISLSAGAAALSIDVFDIVIVAEAGTKRIAAMPFVFEAVTVTESASLASLALIVSAFDAVTLAEAPTIILIVAITINSSDAVTVSDANVMDLSDVLINIGDEVIVSTLSTVSIGNVLNLILPSEDVSLAEYAAISYILSLQISVIESILATESVSQFQSMVVAVSDIVTVTELPTVQIGFLLMSSPLETVTVSEYAPVIIPIPTLLLSSFDVVIVAEAGTKRTAIMPFLAEGATVSESVSVSFVVPSGLFISVADTVTIAESETTHLPVFLVLTESVTISEGTLVITNLALNITMFDTVTVNENAASWPPVMPVRQETVTVAEFVSLRMILSVNIADAVTLTEYAPIGLIQLPLILNFFDTVSLSETGIVGNAFILADLSESITVTENVAPHLPVPAAAGDAVLLGEYATVQGISWLQLDVNEPVAVVEGTVQILMPVLLVIGNEDVTLSEFGRGALQGRSTGRRLTLLGVGR